MILNLTIAGVLVWSNDSGDTVDPSSTVERISLQRSYDGPSQLTIFTGAAMGTEDYAADDVVILTEDGDPIFEGLIALPQSRAVLSPGDVGVDWVVRDRSSITRSATTTDGLTSWRLDADTLENQVDELLGHVATQLNQMGLETTVQYSPADGETDYVGDVPCQPVSLDNVNVTEAMRLIADAAPGVRLLCDFDDAGNAAFRFVRIFSAPTLDIVADERCVQSITVQRSLEGRAGAVQTNSRSASGAGTAEVTTDLVPAWNPALEATWSLEHMNAVDAAGEQTEQSGVYRLWSYAASGAVPTGTTIYADVKVSVGGVSLAVVWRPIEVEAIDFDAMIVRTKDPILKHSATFKVQRLFNPSVPGTAQAGTVRLRYTHDNSGGGVTVPGTRYPSSGYSGAAYAVSPVQCGYVLEIETPPGIDDAAYAEAAHAVLSQPVVHGGLALESLADIPTELLRLNCRINVSRTVGATGLESIAAPLMGYTLDLAGAGAIDLDLSTDRSSELRSAV